MLIHWIWYSQLPRVPLRVKADLLRIFHDPEDIYFAEEEALWTVEGMTEALIKALFNRDLANSREILRVCGEKNISILTYSDGCYPHRLKHIPDPPMVLYYKGYLPDWDSVPVIGIVGTRKASAYGMQVSDKMGFQIADCGGLVVSGGADGIDSMALRGAMKARKKVVAVLGCGADVVYPAKNKELFREIERQGCLITEFSPGTPPHSWNFPQRNRIISGISSGVLVVEAPERSGALNTAQHALDQGRDVFVVPGNIDSPCAAGSNELMRDRAIPVFSGWDVVGEYERLYPDAVSRGSKDRGKQLLVAETVVYPDISVEKLPKDDKKSIDNMEKSNYSVKENALPGLTEEEQMVLKRLTETPRLVDDVIVETGLPTGKVLSILTMLALKGAVQNHPGKLISRKS